MALTHADQNDFPLERNALVETVTAEVRRAHEGASAARVYALVGSWGSGKTWALGEVIASLRDGRSDVDDPVIEFNPWLFGSEAAIGQGFATALLSRSGGTYKRRRSAARLVDDYGPILTPLAARLGLNSSVIAGHISQRLSDVGSPSGMRKLLTAATKDKQFVVVMDDLDRLTPDELLTVFKLMRVVGDIPTITYVLGYDEETLLHLVASTTIGGGAPDRARSYMEKIVERVFVVPPLSTKNVEDLVIRPLVEFGKDRFPDWSESDQELFVYRQRALLGAHVATPRAAHRLLDSVRDLSPELAEEVNYDDWFLAAFLHVFYPEVWALITRERVLMTGESHDLFDDEQVKASAATLKAQLEGLVLPRVGGDRVMKAILRTFDGLAYRLDPRTTGRPSREQSARSRSIGNPDFVDRYIWRSLPPNTISEAFVRQSLVDLSDGQEPTKLQALVEANPSEALDAIYRHLKDRNVDIPKALFFVEKFYTEIGDRSTSRDVFGIAASMRANYAVLLSELPLTELDRLVEESPDPIEDRRLLRDVLVGALLRNAPPGAVGEWVVRARASLIERLALQLSDVKFSWGDRQTAEQVLTLLRGDVEVARAVIARQINSGNWSPLELATLWLEVSNSGDGPRIRRLSSRRLLRDLGPMITAEMQVSAEISDIERADTRTVELDVTRENAIFVSTNGLRSFDPNAVDVSVQDDDD